MQTSLLLPSLIRIFDFVEDTLVRQCSNKFDIALTYSYRWLMPKILRLGIIKHECLLLHSTFRIFEVVCICLIDYEQIMKDSHEIS